MRVVSMRIHPEQKRSRLSNDARSHVKRTEAGDEGVCIPTHYISYKNFGPARCGEFRPLLAAFVLPVSLIQCLAARYARVHTCLV